MNKSIRTATLFALLLVVVLLVNLSWVQVFRDEKYAHNALNHRQFLQMKSIPRGQISAGGLILAKSDPDADGYYSRYYSSSDPAAYEPVTGFLSDVYGATGLESSYNDVLNGTDPSLFASRAIDTITGNKTRGASLKLTLNPEAQEVAYRALADHGYNGAVVAIRPSTGEILAMTQTPSFDPTGLVTAKDPESTWKELTSNEASPLLNHATQETLPPGSIFKIVTTTAGLRNGKNANSTFTGASTIALPGSNATVENYGGQTCGGGGDVTLSTAFSLSCNTAFVQLGIDVGPDAMYKAAESFGIGEKHDLGLPSNAGGLGDLKDDAARGISSIGQRDVNLTVLDAAVMAATVANKGKRMQPYLVSEVQGADLHTISTTKSKEENKGLEPEIAAQLTELMRLSERNTAGYTGADIASKTGTAEHGEDSRHSLPHTWYVAFGPSGNADVAVAVVVKNGGGYGAGATGGSVAAPIGRAVIDAVLRSQR